jgi:hypothetical protein
MKTYWLSFCDAKTGENIGVCVVEVSDEQADEAVDIVKRIKGSCPDGEEWTAAAIGQSLLMECNPGGSVLATEVVDPSVLPPDLPRNRLLREDELQRNGWA